MLCPWFSGELGFPGTVTGETLAGTVLGMAGGVVGLLEGIWEGVKTMVGVGLEYFSEVEAAVVLEGYLEGAGVVELSVEGERLQAGAKARWLQLLMAGSYLGKSSFKSRTTHIRTISTWCLQDIGICGPFQGLCIVERRCMTLGLDGSPRMGMALLLRTRESKEAAGRQAPS